MIFCILYVGSSIKERFKKKKKNDETENTVYYSFFALFICVWVGNVPRSDVNVGCRYSDKLIWQLKKTGSAKL